MTDVQSTTPPQSTGDRATTFQAIQGPGEQHYSGEVLLVSAYAIVWAVVLFWVAIVWRKQSALNGRLDELERVLDKAAASPSPGAGGIE
jgi:CcmD family protein